LAHAVFHSFFSRHFFFPPQSGFDVNGPNASSGASLCCFGTPWTGFLLTLLGAPYTPVLVPPLSLFCARPAFFHTFRAGFLVLFFSTIFAVCLPVTPTWSVPRGSPKFPWLWGFSRLGPYTFTAAFCPHCGGRVGSEFFANPTWFSYGMLPNPVPFELLSSAPVFSPPVFF